MFNGLEAEVLPSVAMAAITVFGEGAASVIRSRLQRDAKTHVKLYATWQTASRYMIGIHVLGRNTLFLFSSRISVKDALMI